MIANPTKTVSAVQTLNELMAKRGHFPEYQLIYDGIERRDGIFTYEVSCFGHKLSASANSKKNAKQNAALIMLNLIRQNDNKILGNAVEQKPKEWWAVMPINVLQDICRREALPHPNYEELGQSGPPHIRIFTTRCTVGTFTRDGAGNTKKISKQLSAKNMIILLSEARESVRQLMKELETRNITRLHGSTAQHSDTKNNNIRKIDSIDLINCSADAFLHQNDFAEARVEILSSTPNERFHDLTLEDIKDSLTASNESLESEVHKDNIIPSKQSQMSNLNKRFDEVVREVIKNSSTTSQESIENGVDKENVVPSKHMRTSLLNLNNRLNDVPREVIRVSTTSEKSIEDEVHKNFFKASSTLSLSSNYFKRNLMCQRWSVMRMLLILEKTLNQTLAQTTEEFARNISDGLRKILMRIEAEHDETVQRTHDGKFMMALYVSTDPMILEVGVNANESNLKVLMYRRTVKALLHIMRG